MSNTAEKLQTHDIGKKPLNRLHSKKLRLLVEYWHKLKGDKNFPDRKDFAPEDVRWMLPELAVVDVQMTPRRYFYRLFGSSIAEHVGADLNGKYLDEVEDQRATELITRSYDEAVSSGQPLATERHEYLEHLLLNYESVALPFSRQDGSLDMLLIGCDFKPYDAGEYQVLSAHFINAADDCDDPGLRQLFEIWEKEKRNDRPPVDSFIDPFVLKPWLGNLIVFQVNPTEPKFVYRLIGTGITTIMGKDYTGKSIDDHPVREMAVSYRKALEQCVARRRPLYAKLFRPVSPDYADQDFIASKIMVLPLVSGQGEVSRLLAAQVFNLSKAYIS